MRERKKLRQLGDLVALQRHERKTAQGEVYLATRSRDRASEIQAIAKAGRDDAAQAWLANIDSESFDFTLGQIRAQALLDNEKNVDQSNALMKLADDRLTDRQSIWRFSDLRVRASEKVEKSAKRIFLRKSDEAQLAETGDLVSYRSARHGH